MAVYHRGADALPLGIAQLELSEYVSMGFEAYGWSAGGGGGCGSCGAGAAHRTAVRLKRELSVNFGSCLSIVSYLASNPRSSKNLMGYAAFVHGYQVPIHHVDHMKAASRLYMRAYAWHSIF